MDVNIEFLDEEAIENVITSMNYHMDKTIFFGYSDMIEDKKYQLTRYMKKYCNVEEVVFLPVSKRDLGAIIQVIRSEAERERAAGNRIFFDVTGGEGLILLAFGILSRELKAPMHMYDVRNNELVELGENPDNSIRNLAKECKVPLDLDNFIELQGGVMNYRYEEGLEKNKQVCDKIEEIWKISKKYGAAWNRFSDFIRKIFECDENLQVSVSTEEVHRLLEKSSNGFKSTKRLQGMLRDLEQLEVLKNLRFDKGRYEFLYGNSAMKSILWKSGTILELYTYVTEKRTADDCRVSIHIDWDGVLHEATEADVLNEIDVLVLRGNVPTFISCKNGRLESKNALHALYELQTVTKRFGGKYAKMVLAAPQPMGEVYLARAEEMGIEVRRMR